MNLDDDDSVFERALRADLPSLSEQRRLRQRILAAGLAAGTALGSTNVAAAAQTSFGASALSKLSALSWPAKLGVAAALAAPVAALPLVDAPVQAAAMVSQVQSSAARVRAQSALKAARAPASSVPLSVPQAAPIAAAADTEREPQLAQASVAARAPVTSATLPTPAAASPNANPPANANGSVGAAQPAVASFDSPAASAPASGLELRNESTLAAETQLLDRAFAALAAGDRTTAAALVADHARRFPNGLLRQERERAQSRLAPDPKGE
ncbi:MAG TPA: hypothetical protein VJV79_06980 [Polyangiaceae bacterium]|nr:hypothetical protein [Polyangiaceae bacterium]